MTCLQGLRPHLEQSKLRILAVNRSKHNRERVDFIY